MKNFTLVLAPAYASDLLLMPLAIAALSLIGWLLVKGVDVRGFTSRSPPAALPGWG